MPENARETLIWRLGDTHGWTAMPLVDICEAKANGAANSTPNGDVACREPAAGVRKKDFIGFIPRLTSEQWVSLHVQNVASRSRYLTCDASLCSYIRHVSQPHCTWLPDVSTRDM
jgi:hypothetical protein